MAAGTINGRSPFDPSRGINLRRFFFEPQLFDLILWVQGAAALPYMQTGTLTDAGVWERLVRTFGSNALGFAIWFNQVINSAFEAGRSPPVRRSRSRREL